MSARVLEIASVAGEAITEADLTIDELAADSRIPSRTIRFYQQKGVLLPPVIKGRVAYYGARHKERLELIAQLQDRGLRIDGIRDLLARIDKGELDVGEWLGLEAQLKAKWADDAPRTLTESELLETFGGKKSRPGLLADLVRTKTVQRHGETYLVKSPALLTFAARLEHAGVDLEIALGAHEILKKHLAKASRELVDHFFGRATDLDTREVLEVLRPLGLEAVRVVFAQEMERVLRDTLESGRGAKLPTRKPRKR